MIGFYNYTVILTYIGTVFGFFGIWCATAGELQNALYCLLVAGFCDLFDGKIASTMKRTKPEKRFGIQIDSLSDLICFGLLPGMIVLKSTDGSALFAAISAMYLLCALIRLAWFNVDEEERQNHAEGEREVYLGLPVTTSAITIPFIFGLFRILKLNPGTYAPWILLCVAVAFITPFKLKKPHTLGKIIMVAVGIGVLITVIMGASA